MSKKILEFLIEKVKLKLQILQIQFKIVLLKRKLTVPNLPKPKGIVVHCGGGNWDFNQVNNHHTNKWKFISSLGFGIGYHWWIGYQDKAFQARRNNERGAHAVQYIPFHRPDFYNLHYIGIGLQGWGEKDTTPNQLIELKKLIDELKTKYNIPNVEIIGHREIANKLCPGQYVFEWLVKNYPS